MSSASLDFACPECGTPGSGVLDCRANKMGIRRRRKCPQGHKFTTQEIISTKWQALVEESVDTAMLAVIRTAERARDKLRNRNRK